MMGKAFEDGICPDHGPVRAERKTDLDFWCRIVEIVTLFHWSDRLPFRCPKCGRLTERVEAAGRRAG